MAEGQNWGTQGWQGYADHQGYPQEAGGFAPPGVMASGWGHYNHVPGYHNPEEPLVNEPPRLKEPRTQDTVAALSLLAGSLMGVVLLIWLKRVEESVGIFFFLFFSILMVCLDVDFWRSNRVSTPLMKYIAFLSRETGKGIVYLYLGTGLLLAIWDCCHLTESYCQYIRAIAVLLCVAPIGSGLFDIVTGLIASYRFNKVTQGVQNKAGIEGPCSYDGFKEHLEKAHLDLEHHPSDYDLIFFALSTDRRQITVEDYNNWVAGGFVLL